MSAEIHQFRILIDGSQNKEIKPMIYGKHAYDDEGVGYPIDEIQDPELYKE